MMGSMHGKGCGMMGKMKGGMMQHGSMDTEAPSDEEDLETEMGHGH